MGIGSRIRFGRDAGKSQQYQGQADSLPLSSYASVVNTSPLETLEVHEQGAPQAADFNSQSRVALFSRRKAAFVSAIITVVVTLVTGVSIVSLSKQAHKNDANTQRLALATQDVDIKNSAAIKQPSELQGEAASLLVNGELITRGGIKVTDSAYVTVLRPATLSANRQINLPDASGALCLDSNNCGFATNAELRSLQSRVGQIVVPTIPSATVINGQSGAVAIQGTSNQVSVSTANGVIALSTPQDLAPISSPTFSGLLLNGNFSVTGTISLPLNCSSNLNGGALTTNASGQLICSDDESSAGGSGVATPGGTAGALAVFTAADTIADSIITQLLGAVTIGGNTSIAGGLDAASLTLATALSVPNGGTGVNTFTVNGVVYGSGAGGLLTTAAPAQGQVLVGDVSGVPQFTALTGDVAITGAGVITIQPNSVNLTTDTVGNYIANIGAVNGLSISGNSGEGSTPTLNVVYGSTANSAVEGNTTISITAGANLLGGGTIALGGGGTIALDVTSSPAFAGNVTSQGGTVTLGTLAQNGLAIIHDGNGQTGSLTVADLSANRTYTLPDASGIICLSTGNCANAGGGVTTSGGTTDRLAKFTGGQTIGDSSLSDTGSIVTINGSANLVVQGGNATLGTLSQAGSLVIGDGGSHFVSIVGTGFSANRNYTLPDVGSDAAFCMNTGNCVGGGAGGSAPNGAGYLLAGLDGTLTNERVLTAGSNVSLADGGANSNFTIGVVSNPTFSASVTTPLLQSSGLLTLTSAPGTVIAVDAGTTIELQDDTNVTGNLSATGTITFSGYNCSGYANGGVLTTNNSGQLICQDDDGGSGSSITGTGSNGTLALFNGAQTLTNSIITQSGTTVSIAGDLTLGAALAVSNGGTGAVSFTANGVVYGNGTGSLQVTGAGTSGQVLVADALGIPAFVSFSGDVAVSSTGVTTIQANSVALGADTTGNYVATIGSVTGLSISGNSGEASTPSLSVLYGSTINTAVQGNTSLTCATGAGNLTGGGTVITLGTGGACAALDTVNNPTFSTSITTPSVVMTGAGSAGALQVGNLGQATTYTLPDPGQATATVCLSTGNCVGTGGGVTTTGGTLNKVAKFTNSQGIGDSSLSDDGVNVVVGGTTNLIVQGGNATLGTLTQAGQVNISDGNAHTVSLVATGFAANRTYGLPDVGSNAVFCLSTGNCVGGAGGAPNAAAYLVAALDGTLSNERSLSAGNNINLVDGGANSSFTVATVNNPTFTTSVTTPLLQSSGALVISSTSGNTISVDAGTTIELQDSTNITGYLDVSGGFTSGSSNAFQIDATGAITSASGIATSGSVTFSALNCTSNINGGKLTTNGSGVIACADDVATTASSITGTGSNGTLALFNGAQTLTNSIITQSGTTVSIAGDLTLATQLAVAQGGTGTTSFTTNGIVYGNGTNGLQVTTAGTGGQVLIANASGVPTFMSITGDISVSSLGVGTIGNGSVTSAKIADGTIVNADLAAGSFTNITAVGVLTSLQNDGSTVFGAHTIGNLPSGGVIGTAAATVDAYTNLAIVQTTPGQSLTVPAPTNTASGRVILVTNAGSTAFLLNGVVVLPGSAVMGYWNGSSWTSIGLDGGASAVGSIDTQAKSSNGASIVGSNLYLQTADSSYPGLVSTSAQTIAGAKTFTAQLLGQAGLSVNGGATSINASSNFDTNINTGTSTGAITIGNASSGAISVTSGAGLDLFATTTASLYANTSIALDTTTGAINIATNGTSQTVNIGAPATGAITIQNGSTLGITSTTTITGRSTGDALTVSNDSSTGNILTLKDGTTTVAAFADGGAVTLQNSTNSTSAFRVLNQAGTSTVLGVDSSNVRVGVGTASPNATLHVSGNQSSSAWGVSGVGVRVSSATYTDTTSPTGTVAFASANSFGTPTIAASNTGVTYTNGATLYVAGAPAAGTNVSITNPYALYVASGNSIFGGAVTSSGGFTATSGTGFTATTAAANAISLQATTPTAANNSAMVRLGNSIVSGSANGTFLGINAASGFTGDYLNFQTNDVVTLKVTAAGDLTVSGALNVTSTTTLSGNLVVNTNNFFVNTSNGRVGINNASPNNRFTINTPYNTSNLTNVEAVITASAANVVPLVVQLAAVPTANAFQVQSSSGTVLSGFQGGGGLFVASGTPLGSTAFSLSSGTATNAAMKIQASASQSANLLSIQDSNGNVNLFINPTGAELTLGRIAASGTVAQGKLMLSDGTTDNFGMTLQSGTLTASRIISFPDEAGTVCVSNSVNCGFIGNQNAAQATGTFWINGSGRSDTSFLAPGIDVASAGILSVGTSTATQVKIGNSTGTPISLTLDNGSSAPTGVAGGMYYDTNGAGQFKCYQAGVWRDCLSPLVAANTSVPAGNTVTNTTTETSFSSTYTLSSNSCKVGRVYRITARGVYSTAVAAPTLALKIKTSSVTFGTTGATTRTASMTNAGWSTSFNITCYSTGVSGTAEGQGYTLFDPGAGSAQSMYSGMVNTGTVTLDTTTPMTLQISAQWGSSSSSNSITLRQFIVEEL